MADILIRSMEMPVSCVGCILTYDDGQDICCVFTGVPCLGIGRQDNCPLVPLPEGHGRLGDLDELETTVIDAIEEGFNAADILLGIRFAPTIVPAEGGTDDG